MPIYEYQCRTCGHKFEKIVFGEARPECPSCSGKDLEKLLSTFAVPGGGAGTHGEDSAGEPCFT